MSNTKTYGISGMKVIGIYDIIKRVGREQVIAVADINLEINRGEIVSILGPSGCGKTTTLRLIAGFERPNSGHIVINGNVVAGNDTFVAPEKRNVGVVFQEFALFPHLTVQQNIEFGLKNKDRDDVKTRVDEMIKLTGLTNLEERYPNQLSGGQQQRVALARALAPAPLIVLLDEPFASIDPDLRSRMRTELKHILKKANVTAVFVTHDQEEAFLIADRIVVMNNGKIHQIGTPMEVYHNPNDLFVADFVGHADMITGIAHSTTISTEIGKFPLGTNKIKEDAHVTVMVRPSDIDIIPTTSGIGVIKDIEFRGKDTVCSIYLKKSGQIIHSLQNSSYMPTIGTEVDLKVNASHITIFDLDGLSIKNEIHITT